MLFASLVLASCNSKEIATPDGGSSESGIPFEVSTVITKTANDGLQTNWAAKDAINLFHAEAGATSSYTSDGKFTVDEALTGVFSGELAKALEEDKSYDWYAFYPYNDYNKTPAGVSKDTFGYTTVGGTSQTQTGNGSMAHLAGASCPLYGVVKNVASSEKPAFEMNQLVSVVAVNVTNTLADAITVSNVSFTSTEDIVGTYYIDFSGDTPVYTSRGSSYVSETANLTVEDGAAIAQNGSATFYIAIKPHTAASGSALKISVNGLEKTLTLTKDVTFEAGHIKKVNYAVSTAALTLPFEEDFAAANTTDVKAALDSDYSQFISFKNVYTGELGALRVGKSGESGILETVPLNLSTESTVIIRAKRYSNDKPAVRISVNGKNYDTEKLSADYEDYYISLPAISSYTLLTITSDTQSRYYIDNLKIVSGRITPPVIEASEKSVTLAYDDEDVKSMTVSVSGQTGDVICGVYDDEDGSVETSWCTAEYADGKVSYLAEANTETTARQAYIIIAATNDYGTTKLIIPIIQEPKKSSSTSSIQITNWNQFFGTSYNGTISNVKANSLTLSGTSEDVTIIAKNGTSTNGYVKDADFRCYNGYSLTISVPSGMKLIKVEATKGGKTISGVASNVGAVTINNGLLSWTSTSETNNVIFTMTETASFATMTVTYE